MRREVGAAELRRPATEFWLARATVMAVGSLPPQLLPVAATSGLIAARGVVAPRAVPGFASSAMDGYAVRAADCTTPGGEGGTRLAVIGSIYAGGSLASWLPGTAVKVMTGGQIPPGADCVIPWEATDLGDQQVVIGTSAESGRNVRAPDADIAEGQVLLRAGTPVTSTALSAMVASGVEAVSVIPRPRVGVLTTGDELVGAGEDRRTGQIVDSNGPLLKAFIEASGASVLQLRRIRDERAATFDAVRQMAATVDLLVTTGGVSVGEHDWLGTAIDDIGQVAFWNVAMRPGKPLLFGRVDHTPVLALPGNPVSVVACCHLFLGPLLDKLSGSTDDHRLVPATAASALEGSPGRTTLMPGQLHERSFRPLPRGHHGLGALATADGLAVVGGEGLSAGAPLRFAPFR